MKYKITVEKTVESIRELDEDDIADCRIESKLWRNPDVVSGDYVIKLKKVKESTK